MKSRSLRLAKERLAELTPDQLTTVAGANEIIAVVTPTRHKTCILDQVIVRNSYTCTMTCLCDLN